MPEPAIHYQDIVTAFKFLSLRESLAVNWTAKSPTSGALAGGWSFTAQDMAGLAERQAGWDFFQSLNICSVPIVKASRDEICQFTTIGLDFDPLHGRTIDHNTAMDALDAAFDALDLPGPDLIIDSGRGVWAWVAVERLSTPTAEDRATADGRIKGFTKALLDKSPALSQHMRLDTACADLARIARCPGTINQKTGRMARILSGDGSRAPISQARLQAIAAPYLRQQPAAPTRPASYTAVTATCAANLTSRHFLLCGVDHNLESRHNRLFSTAKNLHELGVPRELARTLLTDGAAMCRPNLLVSDDLCVERVIRQLSPWPEGGPA